MSKPNIKDLMAKRNPLAQREAITPANLYTSPQVDKTTSIQVDMDTSKQVDKPTTPQVDKSTSGEVEKPTSREVVKPTKQQVVKHTKPPVEKYTTHLRPETVKSIKREAFENERKDYEIVQEALDNYFKREGDNK